MKLPRTRHSARRPANPYPSGGCGPTFPRQTPSRDLVAEAISLKDFLQRYLPVDIVRDACGGAINDESPLGHHAVASLPRWTGAPTCRVTAPMPAANSAAPATVPAKQAAAP